MRKEELKVYYVIDTDKLLDAIANSQENISIQSLAKRTGLTKKKLKVALLSPKIPESLGSKLVKLLGTDTFITKVEILHQNETLEVPFEKYKKLSN